jgi:hypothetical protein
LFANFRDLVAAIKIGLLSADDPQEKSVGNPVWP